MSLKTPVHDANAVQLGRTLRLLREYRRLTVTEVAELLEMSPSTYDNWEAGTGRINFERIVAFATALKVDGIAIAASIPMGSPEFAVRCADNQLMTTLLGVLHSMNRDYGDQLMLLSTAEILEGLRRICKELEDQLKRKDMAAEAWLATNGFGQVAPGSMAEKLSRNHPPRTLNRTGGIFKRGGKGAPSSSTTSTKLPANDPPRGAQETGRTDDGDAA